MPLRDLSFQFGIAVTTPRYALVSAAGVVGTAVNPLTAGYLIDATTGSYFISQVELGANRAVLWTCATSAALTTLVPLYENATFDAGAGTYPITISTTDGASALAGVTVRVISGPTSLALTTDGSGNATFYLDSGTYTVAATKSGYSFTTTTRTVTGSQTGTLTNAIALTATSIPSPPADPMQGTVYVDLISQADLDPSTGLTVTATRTPGGAAKAGAVLVPETVSDATDVNGRAVLSLIGNDQITPSGTQWRIRCETTIAGRTVTVIDRTITVIAGTVTNLADEVT